MKKINKRDPYKLSRERDYDKLVQAFAISSSELAQNIESFNAFHKNGGGGSGVYNNMEVEYQLLRKDDPFYEPMYYASENICPDFASEEKVLQGKYKKNTFLFVFSKF